jgi:lipoyl(octanoyl) transferase
VLSHRPVFTQGLNGQPQHVLDPGDIPVVRTDRGGQVTYHGHGQLVVYTLVDLKRAGVGVRAWVTALEQVVIDYLTEFGVRAERLPGAPGVYVAGAKIAALGLKVRQGRCYHGLSLNLDVDLAPFARINPCGMANLPVTDLRRCADLTRNQMPDYRQAGSAIVLGLQKILLEQSPMA